MRGAYSSDDPHILRAQMREIAAAGIDTVIVSWWGPGSPEDARLTTILQAARAAGLGVAVHVEPYPGRTPADLAEPLEALAAQGVTDFYLYDSTASDDADWAALNARVAGLRLFANTGLPGKAKAGGFDGLYTYDVYIYDGSSFPRVCASAHRLGLICAPVGWTRVRRSPCDRGPAGQIPRRRCNIRPDVARGNSAGADLVTITSYNEWHEGTQIEPARNVGAPYASYDGAWGKTGRAAERAYLMRTAVWAQRYRAAGARP